jgi:ATP-dependent Lon protease
VKWDKIDKEQYRILLEENMKDVAQIVQTEDDKPQNIDNIITEFSNIMVKTAEQLCPKRKCKKKRKREWTPDMTTINSILFLINFVPLHSYVLMSSRVDINPLQFACYCHYNRVMC